MDQTGLAGTQATRSALESGEIDGYWEYTGTAWLVALQHDEALTDREEMYERVKAEDAENGLVWLPYASADNTYTLMMQPQRADQLGIESISDLASYVREHPNEIAFATNHEFYARPDGFPAVEEVYGFEFPRAQVEVMSSGLTYNALRDGLVDVAMGFATDGRIAAFGFVNLVDDKQFFPVYNPAPVFREEVIEAYPEIVDLLASISRRLDNETLQALNKEVDISGKTPQQAANDWLVSEGLISG